MTIESNPEGSHEGAKAPHEVAEVYSLDSAPEGGGNIKEWLAASKKRTVALGLAAAVVLAGGGFGVYNVMSTPSQPVVPQRAWADDLGQRNLPEAKVVAGAGAGSITTVDNDQDGNIVSAPVVGIDGTGGESGAILAPPEDVAQVGYYIRSAPFGEGDIGTTVMTSHIDYNGVAGFGSVFTSLKAGDPITLTDGNGEDHHYVVSEDPANISKQDPEYVRKTMDTINRADGPAELILVTCGGDFLGAGSPLGYADNIIIRAKPIANLGEVQDFSKEDSEKGSEKDQPA